MKRRSLVWTLLLAAACPAQQAGLRVYFHEIEIEFDARLEPATTDAKVRFPGGVVIDQAFETAESRRVHRSITDATQHRRSFGYDLMLESLPDPQSVRLRMEPLTKVTANPGEILLAPPKFPSIPVVRVGETVALDLLINPTTGQKIVDYLAIRRAAPAGTTPGETARDFATADVQLGLGHPRIRVNGKPLELSEPDTNGSVSAHILWLGLPGAGSFEISLWPEPRLGFQKAGTLKGNTLRFRWGNSEYSVESDGPIAPGPGLYNVYVLHETAWKDGFMMAGSDHAGMIHIR